MTLEAIARSAAAVEWPIQAAGNAAIYTLASTNTQIQVGLGYKDIAWLQVAGCRLQVA